MNFQKRTEWISDGKSVQSLSQSKMLFYNLSKTFLTRKNLNLKALEGSLSRLKVANGIKNMIYLQEREKSPRCAHHKAEWSVLSVPAQQWLQQDTPCPLPTTQKSEYWTWDLSPGEIRGEKRQQCSREKGFERFLDHLLSKAAANADILHSTASTSHRTAQQKSRQE